MSERIRVGIAGTGAYLPEQVVPNAYFEKIVDTSDEWIVQRTGIRERRYARAGESTSDMSVVASQRAIESAGLKPEDIDLIILGTLTPDHLLPATSAMVQHKLGAKNAGAFDVNAACSGFMTAMSAGEAFVASGRARHVLAIGAETLSRFLDLKDRTSCILFGDAAGAAVISPLEECKQGEILRTLLGADGSGYEFIHMVGGGSRKPLTHEALDAGEGFIRVRGREVFRFAVTCMSELIAEMVEGHGYDELCLIVPHQVNQRIIEAALERLGWSDEKVMVNIQHYGNTSAATVPVALDEARRGGRLVKGKLVVLVAFGAGLTWGASLIRW
jgi:3-oxoacyl-[acyl-carrier-protein] synthase III